MALVHINGIVIDLGILFEYGELFSAGHTGAIMSRQAAISGALE